MKKIHQHLLSAYYILNSVRVITIVLRAILCRYKYFAGEETETQGR